MCNKIFNCLFVLKINPNWINFFSSHLFWIAKCFWIIYLISYYFLCFFEWEQFNGVVQCWNFLSIFHRSFRSFLRVNRKTKKNKMGEEKTFCPMTIVCAPTFMWHFYIQQKKARLVITFNRHFSHDRSRRKSSGIGKRSERISMNNLSNREIRSRYGNLIGVIKTGNAESKVLQIHSHYWTERSYGSNQRVWSQCL